MHKVDEGGLLNVFLANRYGARIAPHDDPMAMQDLDGLVHWICLAMVRKGGHLRGANFRCLRQHLRLL